MADPNLIQRSIEAARQSVTLKLLTIGFLILVLLIPTAMVQSLIAERQLRSQDAVTEISAKWGASQTITGPVLTIPYRKSFTQKDGTRHFETRYAHFLPKAVSVKGKLVPTIRYRGIYKAVLYSARLELSGHFTRPDFSALDIDEKDVQWNRATLDLGISDMTGIREAITLHVQDRSFEMNPGVETHDLADSGVSVRLPTSLVRGARIPFATTLELNGSDQIQFIPVGEVTRVQLGSTWSGPSFNGAFLPVKRRVDKNGFEANWKVLHLNRNYPQAWTGSSANVSDSAFGVRLLISADVYQQATRTAKYAVLFIVLTFTIFFFGEIAGRRRLHPIQYLLIGFAIVIFYSLLIALSEHMRFGWAYLIGSVAVIGLITAYARAVLDSVRLTGMVGGILVILYGYLYMVLQLEDYALLMGSVGLFAALAIVMYITRRIDWYGGARTRDD